MLIAADAEGIMPQDLMLRTMRQFFKDKQFSMRSRS
jgi:hypothetical protein